MERLSYDQEVELILSQDGQKFRNYISVCGLSNKGQQMLLERGSHEKIMDFLAHHWIAYDLQVNFLNRVNLADKAEEAAVALGCQPKAERSIGNIEVCAFLKNAPVISEDAQVAIVERKNHQEIMLMMVNLERLSSAAQIKLIARGNREELLTYTAVMTFSDEAEEKLIARGEHLEILTYLKCRLDGHVTGQYRQGKKASLGEKAEEKLVLRGNLEEMQVYVDICGSSLRSELQTYIVEHYPREFAKAYIKRYSLCPEARQVLLGNWEAEDVVWFILHVQSLNTWEQRILSERRLYRALIICSKMQGLDPEVKKAMFA